VNDASRLYLKTMDERYACKLFDPTRSVSEDVLLDILEAGRLSPSSFGLEPWSFIVTKAQAMKDKLFTACFCQENIRTASFVLTIAVRTARHYAPDADFVRQRADRFPGGLGAFLEEYSGYRDFLNDAGRCEPWARAQGYIACANMMNLAAASGVDSCAIEGFKEDEVRSILHLEPADWRISLLIPFGYRGEPFRPKIREPLASLVEFVDA